MTKISVYPEIPALLPIAEKVANQLNLTVSENADYQLIITENYIGLKKTGSRSTPLYIDFLSKNLTWRRQHATVRKETLAKALDLKTNATPTIVDATAGLARDSFILAALGFEITLLERVPLITVLLEDAFTRASENSEVSPIIQRMHLIHTDALQWMKNPNNRPDIIYLDPMFPTRNKSALAKKDMQIFHGIIGTDTDSAQLLPAALTCATKRVVVKRPRIAENLADIPPSFSQEGSSSRFDIYLL
jgi:16S rRNA (guanine1516-N2)-methyltransferase